MKKRVSCILMLAATTLAAPPVFAQASAPAAAQNATNPVDPAAVEALQKMGTWLQSLKRFSVSTDLTGERVLEDGQKLQHSANAELDVDRPHRIRAVLTTARGKREIFFDGKAVTLYTPAQKYFSTVAFDGTIGGLIDRLRDNYGVEIPLADLFVWGTPEAPTGQFESAMYAGQDYINDDLCNHYAFRQKAIDWQIWISAGASPMPRKIVITRRDDDARPQSVSILDWTIPPRFKDSDFAFHPPAGAKKIEIVPVKNKG
ncbi:DUF2092 domain-containing protein [Paraburkholderia fynbosensis]|uniref:Periplasmic protein n=1 Tax=Paraburkholderia fynbosensis TaxID=1200993 RepID=A0A6J5H631_9BURK|nr:DUF2092 domain-containing protein [Paraburkholderia fynbosensis]CAB3809612.1 hypothetical protein LMG27177_06849 [Paraburkholderia fynbosensis]